MSTWDLSKNILKIAILLERDLTVPLSIFVYSYPAKIKNKILHVLTFLRVYSTLLSSGVHTILCNILSYPQINFIKLRGNLKLQ